MEENTTQQDSKFNFFGEHQKKEKKNTKQKSDVERSWDQITFKPIGFIRTCFYEKNGTPRQGILCKSSKAILQVDFGTPNPEHAFDELDGFSHVWLVFVFHQNNQQSVKNKVMPPRLEGKRVGLFATRTPHRPNPIGLSVAKLEKVKGNIIHLSGVDLVHGTPILDIKPYIPSYDAINDATTPNWIVEAPRPKLVQVSFTDHAKEQVLSLIPKLEFYSSFEEISEAISEVLTQDPRSIHLRENRSEENYGFCIDILNVICKFSANLEATVIEIEDWSDKWSSSSRKKQNKKQKKNDSTSPADTKIEGEAKDTKT